jgi:hypothetical protein
MRGGGALLACLGTIGLFLAGCGPVRQARLEYQSSVENYKSCVAARGASACETERVLMETDERQFNNIGSNVAGNSVTNNINVQRR